MKAGLFTFLMIMGFSLALTAQEYLVVTTVESVVPMGIGRSRMIQQTDSLNFNDYTTVRTDGKAAKDKSSRSEIKIDNMEETMLLNFYSAVGINFQNIASNDAMITSKLNELAKQGYRLVFVTSGVESDAGKGDGTGIFITRFIFVKD
jgi:alkyl sulfatase BDS1-like metallo-beta-lactamase superfamily hydrolase